MKNLTKKKVVVLGGGFAGLNCAKALGNFKGVEVTLIDRKNHHLFQPLLYQVATAALNPADIAVPIRALLAKYPNVTVLMGDVEKIDPPSKTVTCTDFTISYDYLVVALGAQHSYFGQEKWERFAPGLKSLEQATEIRRRVLHSFEKAEVIRDEQLRKQLLTFVIVGGGPTGVELAGAIGEMSRLTLIKDFRHIDPKQARVILIEAGKRILPMFSPELSSQAVHDLEQLGVQVWTSSMVTSINEHTLQIGKETIMAQTVIWAAGVTASKIGATFKSKRDRAGRLVINGQLKAVDYDDIYVLGDLASLTNPATNRSLPGLAPVAKQQGIHCARNIRRRLKGKTEKEFHYRDKGQMATIGRNRAIMEVRKFKAKGIFAWLAWLLVHIFYLTSFKNRFFVLLNWGWSYFRTNRGSRLITDRDWIFYHNSEKVTPKKRKK